MNCPKCNSFIPDNASFCEFCGTALTQDMVSSASPAEMQKPDNLITGIVGALIGAVLGAAAIILLSRLGFVASISGLILAVCTTKGYELLGGRLSTRGIIISILLILVTPYIADRIDWAILLMQEYPGVSFADAFNAIPELLEEGYIESGDYTTNLLMIYGFAALGAFGSLRQIFTRK